MSSTTDDYDAHNFEYAMEPLVPGLLLLWKFNVFKKPVVRQVRRRGKETRYFHYFVAGVLEHVDLALWK